MCPLTPTPPSKTGIRPKAATEAQTPRPDLRRERACVRASRARARSAREGRGRENLCLDQNHPIVQRKARFLSQRLEDSKNGSQSKDVPKEVPQGLQKRSSFSRQKSYAWLDAWRTAPMTNGRRKYDRSPLSTSAGPSYQISHWLGWIAAILQAIASGLQ